MGAAGYAKDVLVTTDWLAEHLDDDNVVVAEVDENPDLYDDGHIRGAIRLHWRDDLQDQIERDLIEKESFERAARLARDRQRHDGRPLRRQEQLVRRVRLLVPQDLRPPRRADPRRRPPEVARRGARDDDGRPAADADAVQRPRTATSRSAPTATRCSSGSRTPAARSSTSARRRSTRASCSRRPATSRRARCAAATSRPRSRSRGRRPSATTERSSPPRTSARSTSGKGVTGDKEVTAYCRIGERSAHTWFVLRELLGYETVRNYDGSWTEWGNLVDVPIER